MSDVIDQTIVTAVGISVNTLHGEDANRRLEQAMADEILKCNAEGISTSDENAAAIRLRMRAAYERELAKIANGE